MLLAGLLERQLGVIASPPDRERGMGGVGGVELGV